MVAISKFMSLWLADALIFQHIWHFLVIFISFQYPHSVRSHSVIIGLKLAIADCNNNFGALQVSGYCGLLLGSPIILYEIIAFVLPGLTRAERRFLGPIVLGSSVLFYAGIVFSYLILTPAALNFFISYAEGVVESLWSIDQYFEFVLVLMFSTGLSFQVNLLPFSSFSVCL